MADLNLNEIHDFMITIAKEAGERIVAAKPTTSESGSKKNCTQHLSSLSPILTPEPTFLRPQTPPFQTTPILTQL